MTDIDEVIARVKEWESARDCVQQLFASKATNKWWTSQEMTNEVARLHSARAEKAERERDAALAKLAKVTHAAVHWREWLLALPCAKHQSERDLLDAVEELGPEGEYASCPNEAPLEQAKASLRDDIEQAVAALREEIAGACESVRNPYPHAPDVFSVPYADLAAAIRKGGAK